MLNRCCGATSSTVMVDLDTTYQLTYTWNTSLKGTICHLGANKTPQAIIRAGKALSALKYILEFDKSTGVWVTTNHTVRKGQKLKSRQRWVTDLSQKKEFSHNPGRKHQTFPSIQCNKLAVVQSQLIRKSLTSG